MIKLQETSVGSEELLEIEKVIASGFLTQGKKTTEFEYLVAEYTKSRHALAMSSATTGLSISLSALDISPGDEVIIPAFSFPATANVIENFGAKPVFIDIELETYNINASLIEEKITSKTKVVMPVHAFGLMADMISIMDLCAQYDLAVLEDAACALGASLNGKMAGTFGQLGVFSFHPRKVITTGEGGMVITSRDDLADKIKILRSHGSVPKEIYLEFIESGFNYRLSDINSAIGVIQMSKLENILNIREQLALKYNELLKNSPLIAIPRQPENYRHTFQSYVVLIKKSGVRDEIIKGLRREGIECTLGTYGMHLQPYYKQKYHLDSSEFKNATSAHENALTLPLHHKMKISDLEFVADSLISTLNSFE